MEPPTSLEGEAIRNEKVKLLRSIRQTTPEEALMNSVRGQYGEGIMGGKKVPAYRQEPNVDPEFDRGDICRDQASDRELALGGCALLFAFRETIAAADHEHRLSV